MSQTCVEPHGSLCLQSFAAHVWFHGMRRISRYALPTVARSTYHRHASNLSVRIAHIYSYMRRTSQFALPAVACSTYSSVERASIFRSLCPQSFVAHVFGLTCVELFSSRCPQLPAAHVFASSYMGRTSQFALPASCSTCSSS